MSDRQTPSGTIDAKIASLGDWRGETLARMRKLIHEADTDVVETVKWAKPANPSGVPVWEHDGIICTGEVYRTRRACSMPDSAAPRAAPSTFARTMPLTKRRSGRWSARPWRSTSQGNGRDSDASGRQGDVGSRGDVG
jgi:hypothetical protein